MRTLGISVKSRSATSRLTKRYSQVAVRAPLSGVVTERKFNAGAGIEAATPIFAISNLSTVYVIANVPEAQRRQTFRSVRLPKSRRLPSARSTGASPTLIRVSTKLRARLASGWKFRIRTANCGPGMFTEVGFQTGTNSGDGQELVVPTRSDSARRRKNHCLCSERRRSRARLKSAKSKSAAKSTDYTRIKSGLGNRRKSRYQRQFYLENADAERRDGRTRSLIRT